MTATGTPAGDDVLPPRRAAPQPPRDGYVWVSGGLARFFGLILAVLLLLSVLGYPLVGAGASLYLVEGRDFAIAFRALVLLISLGAIAFALARLPIGVLRFLPLPLTLLLVLYSVRLIVDTMSGQFPDIGEASLYFVGTCVVPAIAVSVLSAFHQPYRDAPFFLIAGILLCILILLTSQADFNAGVDPSQLGQGRLNLTRLNPISIGHVAVSTIVAALAIYFEPGHARWLKLLILPACAVALVCIVSSGSRGPLVSLAGVIGALLVFQRRWRLLVVIGIGAGIWALQATSFENTLMDRLLAVGSDQSSMIRLDLQALAFEQFLQHPIVGSAYIELVTGYNPHNIVLESAMALGVVGLGVILWVCYRAGTTAVRRMHEGQLMLPLLTIQYLLAVQFSGSLSASNEFWVCAALLLASAGRRRPGGAADGALPARAPAA